MTLGGTIAGFTTGIYAVTRYTAGPTTKGRATTTVQSVFSVSASVQPLGGRELMRLPEGERARARLNVFTTTPLQTGTQPDRIRIGTEDWEVESVEDWNVLGGFYRGVVRKLGD